MPEKPANLIYGVDDKPPTRISILMALQHVFVASASLALPVALVQAIGGTFAQVQATLCFSMVAAGIGTILQALNRGPVGSGYLVPNICGPSYFSVCLRAAWLGGLPLMRGMIMIGGAFEALFSRVVHKLKFLFPTEITGFVVLMVAISVVPLASSKFLGVEYDGDPINSRNVLVAALTLGTMAGINVWGKGKLKLYCVIIGIIVGYVLSFASGLLTSVHIEQVASAPWLGLPGAGTEFLGFAFEWSLVVPFLIVSLCGSLKSFGNLVTAQKINDSRWKAPDLRNIGRGLLADSISVMSAGLLGGVATDTSASNVGLSSSTLTTSRVVAYYTGAIFICLAFMPKLTAGLCIMPSAMMGAMLIFVLSFMVMSGIQIIIASNPGPKQIFVIGIAFIFALSVDILPNLYTGIPSWLRPLFTSSLTVATVLAIVLNQILNIGSIRKKS